MRSGKSKMPSNGKNYVSAGFSVDLFHGYFEEEVDGGFNRCILFCSLGKRFSRS
jgi:hypothetical protein